jgi:alpha-tubulin suppressor-like RCC1 family protein
MALLLMKGLNMLRWTWLLAAAALAVACTENTGPTSTDSPDATPVDQPDLLVGTVLSFAQISGGQNHSCGRTLTTGKLYCWGYNSEGQLGNASLNNKKRPTAVSSSLQFRWVSAGASHTCAIASDSNAYCWGANGNGQLGDGTYTDRWSPTLVGGGLSWQQIEIGGTYGWDSYTCGLTTGGKLYCWGLNSSGQLGDGSSGYYTYSWPNPVTDVGVTYRQFSTGGYHACAVSTTNVAYCWGAAANGQTGNGGIFYQPTAILGGHAFRQVSAGAYHTCGTTTSGKAYCWGYGYDGALGNGTTADRFSPRAVSGTLSFSRVFASASHTCGLVSRKAYCWGWNYYGQLGDGTTTKRLTPVAVAGGLLFSQLSSRGSHTCGTTATVGVGYCWGYNGNAQLGDATFVSRLKPTKVAGAL